MNDLILLNNYIIIPLYIITKKPVKSSEKAGQERDKMVCWLKTKYTGVRYREHETRRHGLKPDRYFTIRYKLNGKDKEEALGWASEGWTEIKAFQTLCELKEAKKTGHGCLTLKEARNQAALKLAEDEKRQQEEQKRNITLNDFYDKYYVRTAGVKINRYSFDSEVKAYDKWIRSSVGDRPMMKILPEDIEKLAQTMADQNKSPATINHIIISLQKLFRYALEREYITGKNPVKLVTKLKTDNKRERFLSKQEAELLMQGLRIKSEQMYEIAMLSLWCGLRAGEIFKLTWADIDTVQGTVSIKDTKSVKNRTAFMTDELKQLFIEKKKRTNQWKASDLLFPAQNGNEIRKVSHTFNRVVQQLGLNNGITDRRQKVVFHTLRHTYASWLVQTGVDLYTVQKLMGHSNISMTERYAHLGENTFKKAVKNLERSLANGK